MQVEWQNREGQLTTSLITPSAVTPPKFVLLGGEHHGNGGLRYRLGVAVEHTGYVSFDHLRTVRDAPCANGHVSVARGTGPLHLYGRAHDAQGSAYVFDFVVEDGPGGHIVANVAAMSRTSSGRFSGYVTDGTPHSGFNGGSYATIDGLHFGRPNTLSFHTLTGETNVELIVDQLVVDAGTIARRDAGYAASREQEGLVIRSTVPGEDEGERIATLIDLTDLPTRLDISMPAVQLPRGAVSGHVGPVPSSPSSSLFMGSR